MRSARTVSYAVMIEKVLPFGVSVALLIRPSIMWYSQSCLSLYQEIRFRVTNQAKSGHGRVMQSGMIAIVSEPPVTHGKRCLESIINGVQQEWIYFVTLKTDLLARANAQVTQLRWNELGRIKRYFRYPYVIGIENVGIYWIAISLFPILVKNGKQV